MANKNNINKLFKDAPKKLDDLKNIVDKSKAVTKTGTKSILNTAAKHGAPVIGGIWDVYSGIDKIHTGHPVIGTGQALFGLGSIGLDALDTALLASGIGSPVAAAGQAGKMAARQGLKQVARKLVNTGAKNIGKAKVQLAGAVLPEIAKWASGDKNLNNNQQQNTQPKNNDTNNKQVNNQQLQTIPQQQYIVGNTGDGIERMILDYYNNTQNKQTNNVPNAETNDTIQENTNINPNNYSQILDYYNNNQEVMKPYLDMLENYISNYDRLRKGGDKMDRYWAAAAGYSKNPAYTRLIGINNPADIEAKRIDLYGKLAEQELNNNKQLQQLVGNAVLAQSMGLDPIAGMADPKFVNANIQMQKLNETLKVRREIANLNAKEKELDRQVRVALKQGDWKNAQSLQNMRNNVAIQKSIISGISFGGDPAQINNALSAMGYRYQIPIDEE